MKTAAGVASIVLGLLATSALAAPVPLSDAQLSGVVAGEDFSIVNEVSDQFAIGANPADPLLVNAWGLSQAPGGPLWVANNGTGTSTLYRFPAFTKVPLNVSIPGGGGEDSAPTGTVFTSFDGNSFRVSENGVTGHSFFLFDGEDGAITGWAPSVSLQHAIIAIDESSEGSVFKGLTLTNLGSAPELLAADFANNRVEVYNNQFQKTGEFTDPSLPEGYAPFNVQTLNGKVYVTFALHGEGEDEAHGAGLGFVDVFDTSGHKLQTLISGGPLNAPWGLTIAPASFGQFAGALLVGNFGDGKVNAFNPTTGAFLGTLSDAAGAPLFIDGLWALRNGPDGTVVFSSGPDDESHGLIGVIRPNWAAASWAYQSHVTLGH
ncbi:MAG TPA: TIGR03118 family protein [Caulobacteraceae bacterium]|jgi:uncharacterized protein (TIGR03118 family)|nr:TIGR03118 family protein [Caulobacteraceae bacterium]